MSGLWCVNAGYGREELVNAAADQMRELPYYNNFFQCAHPPSIELATMLKEVSQPQFNRDSRNATRLSVAIMRTTALPSRRPVSAA